MQKESSSVDAGYKLADGFVKEWNANPNPPKIYIGGKRIHHGLVGLVLTGLGCVGLAISGTQKDEKNRELVAGVSGISMGAGLRLIEDDIEDMPDWFNFEK